jgi:hypothetical protein
VLTFSTLVTSVHGLPAAIAEARCMANISAKSFVLVELWYNATLQYEAQQCVIRGRQMPGRHKTLILGIDFQRPCFGWHHNRCMPVAHSSKAQHVINVLGEIDRRRSIGAGPACRLRPVNCRTHMLPGCFGSCRGGCYGFM